MKIEAIYHDVEPTWSSKRARGLYTLVYVTEGRVLYTIDGCSYEIVKDEIVVIPSHMDRAWKNHPELAHRKYTILFEWEDPDVLSPFVERQTLFRFKPRNPAYYEQRFAFLFMQWLGRRKFYEQLSLCVLTELLTLLSQEKSERRASPVKEKMVRRLQEHILMNFKRNITIDELAELAAVTPNYVTILFKDVIGVTPLQYLHQIRINTAVDLLKTTEMTVGAVAEHLGYCDQSYFNRMFKKLMGMPPTHIKVGTIR